MLYSNLVDIAGRIAASPAIIPLSRRVGIELEVQGNCDEQSRALRNANLARPNGRYGDTCSYSCSNDNCGEYLVHPKHDGTVSGVEAVVGGPKGTNVSDPILHSTLERTAAVLTLAGAYTDDNTGSHVHVNRSDMNFAMLSLLIDNAAAVSTEMRRLMSGQSLNGIRRNGYASDEPTRDSFYGLNPTAILDGGRQYGNRGAWMWFSGKNTVEMRGWNGTVLAWRMVMATYVSAAFVQAAVDGRAAVPGAPLLDLIGDYLPHYVIMLVVQQDKYMGGVTDFADDKEVLSRESAVNSLNKKYRASFAFPGTSFAWSQEFMATSTSDASRQARRWMNLRIPTLAAAAGVDDVVIANAVIRSRFVNN